MDCVRATLVVILILFSLTMGYLYAGTRPSELLWVAALYFLVLVPTLYRVPWGDKATVK